MHKSQSRFIDLVYKVLIVTFMKHNQKNTHMPLISKANN